MGKDHGQDHIDVSFSCDACGAKLLWKYDLRDDEIVTCPDCGKEAATLGEIKAAAMEASKEAVEKIVGQPIKWDRK